MKLYYIGPPPQGVVPLPEGWCACDHDEPDAEIAKEKLAFKIKGSGSAYSKTEPKAAPDEKE